MTKFFSTNKILATVLALLLLVNLSITSYAVPTSNSIQDILNQIMLEYPNGSYFSVNGRRCEHSNDKGCDNCRLASILKSKGEKMVDPGRQCATCWAFVRYISIKLYGWDSLYNYSSQHPNGVKTIANGSTKNASTFSNAQVDDILWFYSNKACSGNPGHMGIFMGSDATGIWLYDSNIGGRRDKNGTPGYTGAVRYGHINYGSLPRDYCSIKRPVTVATETPTVTITFDPNGGSVSPNTQKIVKGSDPSNLPTPTRRGYTFKGWMFDKIDPDSPPLSSSGVVISENSAWGFEEDTTLYAFWVKNAVSKQYTVTLDDGSTCKQITVTGGGTYSNLTTPSKDGYTFDGWYTAEVGGTKITTSTKVNLTGDQTLYAHWTQISTETKPSKPEPSVPPSSHSHSGSFKYAESSHPHLNYYTCSTCGEDYTDGSTTPDKKCDQCWGPWSVWSYTPAYSSETRQVESQHTETQVKIVEGYTEYRYGGYATSDGKHECWCDTYLRNKFGSANLRYSDWSRTRYSENGKGWSCGQCSGNHIHVGHYDNNSNAWWPEYTLPGGKNYYWEETRTVPDQYETRTETVYRYRDWTHG